MRYISKFWAILLIICVMCTACGIKTGTGGNPAGSNGVTDTDAQESKAETTEAETETTEPEAENIGAETETAEIESETTEPVEGNPETEAEATEQSTESQTVEATTGESGEAPIEPGNLHTEETQTAGEEIVQTFKIGMTLLADLNGDGEDEKITVKANTENTTRWRPMEMQIDEHYYDCDLFMEIIHYMENPDCVNFYLVDLDTADNWRELAFYENGPSGDPATSFLRYDDGELIYIGTINNGPPGVDRYGNTILEIPGDGTISGTERVYWFQTDRVEKTWKLVDATEFETTFEEVIPEYYEFVRYPQWELHTTLALDATFFREMGSDADELVTLTKGTLVDLARYYPEEGWLQVTYEQGTKSVWLKVTEGGALLPMNINIDAYFDGLSAAG